MSFIIVFVVFAIIVVVILVITHNATDSTVSNVSEASAEISLRPYLEPRSRIDINVTTTLFSNPCLDFLSPGILTSLHHSIFPAWLPGYPWFYRTWCNKTSDTVLQFLLLSTDSLDLSSPQVLCLTIPRKGNILGNIQEMLNMSKLFEKYL